MQVKKIKNFFISIICILFFISGNKSIAQQIFDSSTLHEIRLNFPEQNWYDTLVQYYSDAADGSPKKILPVSVNIDGISLSSKAGIRFKGEYSYTGFPGKKKPFRIHFNKISSSQNYQGIKKINLHNLAGDPSFLREFVSYNLLRSMGIAASRTSYTRLFINNIYWGCYLIVEEPEDKLFLKSNFVASNGNLIEAASTTRLNWKGNDPAAYTELKLQSDESDSAWTKTLAWINLFNNNFSYNFQQQLYSIFNADEYFKILAADVFLNNWDSYANNGRNFFIYDDPTTQHLRWVPWDYNLSMWQNDLSIFPTDANSNYGYKPLIWRIKENTQLRQTYLTTFCNLLNTDFKTFPLEEKTIAAFNLIKQAVEEDSLKFYSSENFYDNRKGPVTVAMLRSNVLKNVLLPGITPLFKRRLDGLRAELLINGCDCDKTEKENFPNLLAIVFPNPSNGHFSIYTELHPDVQKPMQVRIYNIAGQLVKQFSSTPLSGKLDINVPELQSGVYILSIYSGQSKTLKKIIKY